MRLHADGRLALERFEFPFAERGTPSQECNAYFVGEFAITLRPFFFGPNTFMPFVDGKVIVDRSNWEIEEQIISGVISYVLQSRFTKKPIGLMIDFYGNGFVPLSLVPEADKRDLDSLVGRPVECSIYGVDDERDCFILKIERIR